MKVLFTGGGTGGSVTPLIALYQEMLPKTNPVVDKFFWVGRSATKKMPKVLEQEMVASYNIKYYGITSGKLRRYFSWDNFIDPLRLIKAFFQSLKILRQTRPNIIITAGSFISVPVIWAGSLLRIPILVHQQDLQPGLANKIMAGKAKKVTVSWKESLKNFAQSRTVYTGNPVRQEVVSSVDINKIKQKYKLDDLPIVLVLGGGTGATMLNKAIVKNIEQFVGFANVFHITGKGKKLNVPSDIANINRYRQFEFVGLELLDMMKMADTVITRAGMGTLSELAVMGKPTVIVPIPDTHQVRNAYIFYKYNAAVLYKQKYLKDESFVRLIKDLLGNRVKRDSLSLNIKNMMPDDASLKISEIILDIIKNKR